MFSFSAALATSPVFLGHVQLGVTMSGSACRMFPSWQKALLDGLPSANTGGGMYC